MSETHTCTQPATGGPGSEPCWTSGAKEAIGTSYSTDSHIWYTMVRGSITELYYPTIDRPQVRDVRFLISDGQSFCHDEQALASEFEVLSNHALGVRVTSAAPDQRYRLIKEIITDPHLHCLLIRIRLEATPEDQGRLRVFLVCRPHLEMSGRGNHGETLEVAGHPVLAAWKRTEIKETWLVLGAKPAFSRCACGFVGVNDGATDLTDNYQLDHHFSCAHDGTIALTGELDLSQGSATICLAFGEGRHNAVSSLTQSLSIPFDEACTRFIDQWERGCKHLVPLEQHALDHGTLAQRSQAVLLAYEDKFYPGALIAALSIPWGQIKGDEDSNAYHLVWTRDMVQAATGLLATGNLETPLRALIYLAISQRPDGGFYQNFWVNGEPRYQAVQLDEVAFPILLAYRLHRLNALKDFDPLAMVRKAAAYLMQHGPATPQERWEEASGYSPATLATMIAALTCAAVFVRERGDPQTAGLIQDYADFLECHLEGWTVTTEGTLVPDIRRHFIRIHPTKIGDPAPAEDPNHGILTIANRGPDQQAEFPAREIVDAGFLQLVRFGIRKPDDRLIKDSLAVIDAVLKVELPAGPCWYRYNHDGYGERPDGQPFEDWGKGRPWPLLTGERAHYELAAGHSVEPYLKAMEGFAAGIGVLPEQVWDAPDKPEAGLLCGRPTHGAMPLAWTHAEYLKLLRSIKDGQGFDHIPEVAERYANGARQIHLEIWTHARQPRRVTRGWTLRIQAGDDFELQWSARAGDERVTTRATMSALGIAWVDIPVSADQEAPIRFRFHWVSHDHWDEQEQCISVG